MNNVVVTGIGLVTPLGLGRDQSWNELLLGHSAVNKDPALGDFLSARVQGLDVPNETRMLSMSFLASLEAVMDSGADSHIADYSRFACTLSTSKPNILNSNGKIVFPEIFVQSEIGAQTARILKLGGQLMNVSAACATGAVSVITAARWIQNGYCDLALAGAVESPFHPLYTAGFSQLGVLAKHIARPFDQNREGFALGEGAAVLVLERKDNAVLRGAKIYGEISGWGLSNYTHNAVSFDKKGTSLSIAVKKALEGRDGERVDYIHAHGTGTKLNDAMETQAYKDVFGAKAKELSISSTKAATGHLLGASGALGLAFTLLSLRDSAVPPTLNLLKRDPECDLNYTANRTVEKEVRSALSVSFGFGGQIAVVGVSKP